jgi:predicted outer membrane lipoprotein
LVNSRVFTARRSAQALTIGKGPHATLNFNLRRIGKMQTLLLSCAFGVVCTMVLWVVSAAAAKHDRLARRGLKLFPPEEI